MSKPQNFISHGVSTYTHEIKTRLDGETCMYLELPLYFEDEARKSLLMSRARTAIHNVECELKKMSDEAVKLECENIQAKNAMLSEKFFSKKSNKP